GFTSTLLRSPTDVQRFNQGLEINAVNPLERPPSNLVVRPSPCGMTIPAERNAGVIRRFHRHSPVATGMSGFDSPEGTADRTRQPPNPGPISGVPGRAPPYLPFSLR